MSNETQAANRTWYATLDVAITAARSRSNSTSRVFGMVVGQRFTYTGDCRAVRLDFGLPVERWRAHKLILSPMGLKYHSWLELELEQVILELVLPDCIPLCFGVFLERRHSSGASQKWAQENWTSLTVYPCALESLWDNVTAPDLLELHETIAAHPDPHSIECLVCCWKTRLLLHTIQQS